jgi:hypothetical protein
MKFLSALAARLSGRSPDAGADDEPTDLELSIVQLDPPDGSTLKAGEDIEVIVQWRYSRPRTGVAIWVKPEPPAGVGGGYEGDSGEARRPGQGRVLRGASLKDPARLETLLLVAKDAHSREIFHRRIPVDYTFVADAEQEARLRDGVGSRITSVQVDPASPARLAPGTRVLVHIGYDARSRHGVRPVAMPVTELDMTWNGAVEAVHGQGRLTQHFTVGAPGVVRQVRALLYNEGGAVVDEALVDVDLRFGA